LTVYVKFSGDGEELSTDENPLFIISGNGLTLQYKKELPIIPDQEQVYIYLGQNIFQFLSIITFYVSIFSLCIYTLDHISIHPIQETYNKMAFLKLSKIIEGG